MTDWREYRSRFTNARRRELMRLALRYVRLQTSRSLLRAQPSPDGMAPIIICLTTIPSRLSHLAPTLNSLIDQTVPATDIRLYLPTKSRREGRGYTVPDYLDHSRGVSVVRCEQDWGPATRLIPELQSHVGANRLLITVDDDAIYPPDMIATLLRWRTQLPGSALAYRGWPVPRSLRWRDSPTIYGTALQRPAPVDVVTSTWGVLIEPQFFDEEVWNYDGYPPDAFFVDDLWFSGHLALRAIPRLVIPARLPPLPRRLHTVNSLIQQENSDGSHNDAMLAVFSRYWSYFSEGPAEPAQSTA